MERLTSRKYKIGFINCLIDRSWKICKDDDDRRDEISKIKSILAKNEYPQEVIE